MRVVTCGIWPCRRGLAAVAVDEKGRTLWSTAEPPDDGQASLLLRLSAEAALKQELVLPDWLARSAAIARLAHDRGLSLWLVPASVVESVRIVGRLGPGPPQRTAAALARLPLAPVLRALLRRSAPPDTRQLSMLP